MFKKRSFVAILILILLISLTGCAALQRKFTRKKRKQPRPTPVITTFDYAKDLRVEELYKKRFLYWKTWHTELLNRMDAGYKKRVACYDHALMNLKEMQKYLKDAKISEIEPLVEKLQSIDPDIRKKRLSKGEEVRMRRVLEKTKRQIDKNFSYSKVKDYLELKK